MNFTNPTALFWAALAVPIVIFYILKIRLRRTPVSTVMFWEQVFQDRKPRSIWQSLRHLVSLLLQLAFLALLVFALTDPFFDWELRERRRLILVLDNSASMQASDIEPTRLAAAKEQANAIIRGLKPRDEMAILTAGSQPRVVCGLTSHHKTLLKALERTAATDSPTGVAEAVELARRLLGGHDNGQVVVLTDGCFTEAAEVAHAEDVVWSTIGSPETGNVGISQFQVRRSLLDPLGYEILVAITNASDESVHCRLELELGENLLDVIPLELDPDETWQRVLQKTSLEGGNLTARLDHDDVFPTDNAAQAILPESRRIPVTLVSEGNVFLERVLQANALVDLQVRSDVPPKLDPHAVLILHGRNPEQIPDDNVFVIQPDRSSDLWTVGETLVEPLVTETDDDSDLLLHVRLDHILMPEALQLTPQVRAHALITADSGDPLYLQFERKTGKALVLSVNLSRGDLPLRTAFPIIMSNALTWFAERGGTLHESIASGETAEVDLPTTLPNRSEPRQCVLTAPDRTGRLIPAGDTVVAGPLDQTGIWSISVERNAQQTPELIQQLACNLANAQESDLRSPENLEPGQIVTAGFRGRPVWFLLVLLAWLLMAIEWMLYQRRWIS